MYGIANCCEVVGRAIRAMQLWVAVRLTEALVSLAADYNKPNAF